MPGYQPVRIMQPSSYFAKNEPIYGHTKGKKKGKGAHPLFEDLKSRNVRDRMDYQSYLRTKDLMRNDHTGQNFNSLKLLGSCNDLTYLDSFMSMPRNRLHSTAGLENDSSSRSRGLAKSSTTVFNKGDKRNSIHSDSTAVTAAMLSSLRNSNSEDNLYESVEMIHYLKTMQSLNRQKKTRSIQKTGHPLFDSLREEQAMREPSRKVSSTKKPFDEHAVQGLRGDYTTSDGNSPSHSCSSSGDEYEIYPRVLVKASKGGHKNMQPMPHRRYSEQMQPTHHRRQEKQKVTFPKKKMSECNGSESDEEFKIIPRPKFVGKGVAPQQKQPQHRRRSYTCPQSDESDSSFNSAVLR